MGNLSTYDSWRLSEPPHWGKSGFTGEFTTTIDELVVNGCYIEAPVGWNIALEITCEDGDHAVDGVFLQRCKGTGPHTYIMSHVNGRAPCPVWLGDAVHAWLSTADGQRFVQDAVDSEAEAA